MPELSITGTLVNYFVLCRRKAWLAVHGLWMEQESEAVALGRLLDETTYADELQHVNVEVEDPEGLRLAGRIDWAELRDGVLHETKRSPSGLEAHRWQLTADDEARLRTLVQELHQTAARPTPPSRLENRRFCKKCAYEELCFG